MKEQYEKQTQDLIEKKQNIALEAFQSIFDKAFTEILNEMKKSSELYPTVCVNWTSLNKSELELKCDEHTEKVAITVPPISYKDAVSFIEDFTSTDDFKKFDVDVSHPSFTRAGNSPKHEYGITVKISLKTLF